MSGKEKNNTPAYKIRFTSAIIYVLAAMIMLGGLAELVIGILWTVNPGSREISGPAMIIAGVAFIVLSSVVFLIVNLSEDVHQLLYDMDQISNANAQYQKFILDHLQSVDRDHEAIKNGIAAISGKMQQ